MGDLNSCAELLTSCKDRLRGRFVVVDGPDGSGKSTVIRAVQEQLSACGVSCMTCRDPGGTPIGDRIRSVLLDHDLSDMDPTCEVLLFMASRAQLVAEVIRPALQQGGLVLCDRFVSSTCAYQVACGADFDTIIELARKAVGDTWPELTIVLDVSTDVGFDRIRNKRASDPNQPAALDGMERRPRDFHQRVRENFLALPNRYPGNVVVVDAAHPPEHVTVNVLEHIGRLAQSSPPTI